MSNLPTTSLKFIDIANAYNASGLGNVGTTNLKLSDFAGAVLTDGTVPSSGPFNTSMFYGKTFGSGDPDEPTNLSVQTPTTNSYGFTWTETSDWGSGSTASRQYRIRLYKGTAPSTPGGAGYVAPEITGSPSSTTTSTLSFTPAVQGESYWISVRAETDVGESNWVLSPETIVLLPLKIIKIQSRSPGAVIPAVRILKTASTGLPATSWEYVPDGSTSGLWDWADKPWASIYTMDPYEYIIGIRYGKSSGSPPAVSYLQIFTWDTSLGAAGSHNNQVLTSGSVYGEGSFVTINATSGNHITEITGSSNATGSGWADSVPRVLTITGQQAY